MLPKSTGDKELFYIITIWFTYELCLKHNLSSQAAHTVQWGWNKRVVQVSPFIQRILYSTIFTSCHTGHIYQRHKGFCVKLFAEVNCHWHICRGFKQDCPTGELYKEKIVEMYSLILPSGNAQVLRMISDVGECSLFSVFFGPGFRRSDLSNIWQGRQWKHWL